MGSAKEVLSKAEVNENPVIKTPEHTHEEFRLSVLATSHCWKTSKGIQEQTGIADKGGKTEGRAELLRVHRNP